MQIGQYGKESAVSRTIPRLFSRNKDAKEKKNYIEIDNVALYGSLRSWKAVVKKQPHPCESYHCKEPPYSI